MLIRPYWIIIDNKKMKMVKPKKGRSNNSTWTCMSFWSKIKNGRRLAHPTKRIPVVVLEASFIEVFQPLNHVVSLRWLSRTAWVSEGTTNLLTSVKMTKWLHQMPKIMSNREKPPKPPSKIQTTALLTWSTMPGLLASPQSQWSLASSIHPNLSYSQ